MADIYLTKCEREKHLPEPDLFGYNVENKRFSPLGDRAAPLETH